MQLRVKSYLTRGLSTKPCLPSWASAPGPTRMQGSAHNGRASVPLRFFVDSRLQPAPPPSIPSLSGSAHTGRAPEPKGRGTPALGGGSRVRRKVAHRLLPFEPSRLCSFDILFPCQWLAPVCPQAAKQVSPSMLRLLIEFSTQPEDLQHVPRSSQSELRRMPSRRATPRRPVAALATASVAAEQLARGDSRPRPSTRSQGSLGSA